MDSGRSIPEEKKTMSYGGLTHIYINALKLDAGLMAQKTCHDGASSVEDMLGTGSARPLTGTPNVSGALDNGVYRLDISTVEEGVDSRGHWACNFDHSLALFKRDTDLVLLQCYSRRYSMGDWLNLQGILSGSPCGMFYSPGSESASTDTVKAWVKQLDHLANWYNARKWSNFNTLTANLFASAALNDQECKLREAKNSQMQLRWRFKAIAPVDQVM